MSQISVTLVRADTNQEFDVELPDDAPIAELLPALVKELGLPLTGPDGNQVAYELSSKRTGREFKEKDTLGTGGAKGGDVLLLTSTFVAGVNNSHVKVDDIFSPEAFTRAAQEALARDVDPERKHEVNYTPAQKAAMDQVRLTHKAWSVAMTKSNKVKDPTKLAKLEKTIPALEKAYRDASNARDKAFGR